MPLQVLRFFPRDEDDADDFSVRQASHRLRPWVNKLLQLGIVHVQGLRLNTGIIASPKVLGQLPLRFLELDIEQSFKGRLKEIMEAVGQCTTLEYLFIEQHEKNNSGHSRAGELPELCLCKASNLKHVHLRGSLPKETLSLKQGCQLRLDFDGLPYSWDSKWKSEYGKMLTPYVPVMCLRFNRFDSRSWPLHLQDFKALQYLELERPPELTDLARLNGIPHVKIELDFGAKDTLSHTAGSWQSLEIYSKYHGFGISFANIDAFVRDNPKYLFSSGEATKAWWRLRDSLKAAEKRQGVELHIEDRGSYYNAYKLSNVGKMVNSGSAHLVCMEEFWPKKCMWSCLDPATPGCLDEAKQCDDRLRCSPQLYDTSPTDSESDQGFDYDYDSGPEFEPEYYSEAGPDSEVDYDTDLSWETESSADLSESCGALSGWEVPLDLDREEHAREMAFWCCPTWQDATSAIDEAQYDGNRQLQALYEVCSYIGHGSREDYMTWNDV